MSLVVLMATPRLAQMAFGSSHSPPPPISLFEFTIHDVGFGVAYVVFAWSKDSPLLYILIQRSLTSVSKVEQRDREIAFLVLGMAVMGFVVYKLTK